MEDYFAAMPITNATAICVGGITSAEADRAREDGLEIDGLGFYLFIADQAEPSKPIQVLAKFACPTAAERLARLFQVRMAAP